MNFKYLSQFPNYPRIVAINHKILSSWYRSHQFIEVEVVQLHDLSLVPQRGDLLVLVELYDGESWAWEGELNGVAPNFALVGNTRLGVVLWKNIPFIH